VLDVLPAPDRDVEVLGREHQRHRRRQAEDDGQGQVAGGVRGDGGARHGGPFEQRHGDERNVAAGGLRQILGDLDEGRSHPVDDVRRACGVRVDEREIDQPRVRDRGRDEPGQDELRRHLEARVAHRALGHGQAGRLCAYVFVSRWAMSTEAEYRKVRRWGSRWGPAGGRRRAARAWYRGVASVVIRAEVAMAAASTTTPIHFRRRRIER